MTGQWAVAAASVVGRAHARGGMSNQDNFAVVQAGNASVVAVADGASNAGRAAVASSMAVAVATAVIAERLRGALPGDAIRWHRFSARAAGAMTRCYRRRVGRLRRAFSGTWQDFATTLTVVIVAEPWCIAIVIGDGFVVTRAGRDRFGLLVPPAPARRATG